MPVIRAMVPVRRDERTAWCFSFLTLFLILCGYYMIRPIRETLGVDIGAENLQWLFMATFAGMLLINPLFAGLASRWSGQIIVPGIYLTFTLSMLLFGLLLSRPGSSMIIASAFYIWVSIFNYLMVSVFWSVLADRFTSEQSKRLFGSVAAGGTLGALCGPLITSLFIGRTGIPGVLFLSASFFFLVTISSVMLVASVHKVSKEQEPDHPARQSQLQSALGGSPWSGMGHTLTSSYLRTIGIYMMLGSAVGSMIYMQQNRIVDELIPREDRPTFFARTDLAVNFLALFTELFLAGPMFSRMGLRFPLTALPLIGIIGIPVLAASPTPFTVAALLILRRAAEYALAKPAREVLFTVVTREQKYKSKNFIDTVLARAGDTLGVWTPNALIWLTGQNAFSPLLLAFAAIPPGIAFAAAGIWLAKEQNRRAAAGNVPPEVHESG